MQRVSAFLPSWDKRRSGAKKSIDKTFAWADKSPLGLHRLSTQASTQAQPPATSKVHRESFWPATLDKECDRAARILKSFCTDGYLASFEDEGLVDPSIPKTPTKVTKKIPPRIIQNAAGIAVFTCMRSGLWMTGSGGTGILIARKADGTWSPPSGILLHTPTLSFIIGVDIYDCVLVINDLSALEVLTRPSVTLGEDVPLSSGPLVATGSNEIDPRWKELGNTIMTYMKARGQSQNVNLSGCILTERANENERFYSGDVTVMDVLAGNVARHVEETRPLFEVIKAAEGRTDFDQAVLDNISAQCAPGDAVIETPRAASPVSPRPAFGIPNADDPDPFGVLALEMAGLEIREAGTRLRPTSSQFEFNPSPTSPLFSKFHRQSVDAFVSGSNRGSIMSAKTVRTAMSDACTQTDVANTPETTPSPSQSEDGRRRTSLDHFVVTAEPEEIDYTKIDMTSLRKISDNHSLGGTTMTEKMESSDEQKLERLELDAILATAASTELPAPADEDDEYGYADDEEEEEDDEEPVIYEVAAAVQPVRTAVMTSQAVQVKGSLVTIPKRRPPPLPIRSPARNSRTGHFDLGESVGASPLKQVFTGADLEAAFTHTNHGVDNESKTADEVYPGIVAATTANDTKEEQGIFHHITTVTVA